MADEPALLLGVGAAKAGTTWLYSYLAGHAECRLRAVKELHYFDAVDRLDENGVERQIMRLSAERERLARQLATAPADQQMQLQARIEDHEELLDLHRTSEADRGIERYKAYLMRDSEGARLVADITPAYSLLSKARLSMMARLTATTRVVYLMRDPVDRLWSHVRMHAVRSAAPGEDVAQIAMRSLRRIVRKGALSFVTRRGDYVDALSKLLAAVPGPRLFVDFYEHLISADGIARLCAFLGIGYAPAPLAQRVHVGPEIGFDPELRQATARMLRPQYDFVEQTLGPLPERWQANRMGE